VLYTPVCVCVSVYCVSVFCEIVCERLCVLCEEGARCLLGGHCVFWCRLLWQHQSVSTWCQSPEGAMHWHKNASMGVGLGCCRPLCATCVCLCECILCECIL
jgi:hypothetical protein